MGTSFLTQWFSARQVNAICWTLIHSLWIGLITAALAGLIIVATKKSASAVRYRLLCATLVLFVVAAGITYLAQLAGWRQTPQNIHFTNITLPANLVVKNVPVNVANISAGSAVSRLITFLNMESGWIFMIWLVLFAYKSIKMAGGLFYIHRIRSKKTHAVAGEWLDKLAIFSQKLGIRESVGLLRSELVKVPVTVGFFKPVILLPFDLLLQLPAGQVETILWHELAHIHRRDYLVNILQTVVETVFFFNPALLWISSLIREEREASCDEMVLANVSQKGNYLQALLAFQQYNEPSAGASMAMGLGGNQLKNRLKRMINQENKKLNPVEKVVLLAGVTLLCIFSMAPKANAHLINSATYLKKSLMAIVAPVSSKAPSAKAKDKPATVGELNITPATSYASRAVPVLADSLAAKDTVLKFTSLSFNRTNADTVNAEFTINDDKGVRYHFKIINRQIISLDVNGSPVNSDQFGQYQYMVNRVYAMMDEKTKMFARRRKLVMLRRDSIYKIQYERQKMNFRKNDSLWFKRDDNFAKDVHFKFDSNWKPAAKMKVKAKLDREQAMKRFAMRDDPATWKATFKPEIAAKWAKRGKQDSVWKMQADMDRERARLMRDDQMAKTKMRDSVWMHQRELEQVVVKQKLKSIINDLITANIVKDKNGVDWFGLTETELIVNGVKQPEELHLKLKEKYMRDPRLGFYYGPVQMYGTGYFYGKKDL